MHHNNNNIDIVDTCSAASNSSGSLSINNMNSHTIDEYAAASDSPTCLSTHNTNDTVTLGSSDVVNSSNTSVVPLAKASCDQDSEAKKGIQ